MPPLGFVHAPTNLGPSLPAGGRARRPGKLPQALARRGVLTSIGATTAAALTRLPHPDEELEVENTRPAPAVHAFTLSLANAVPTRMISEAFVASAEQTLP